MAMEQGVVFIDFPRDGQFWWIRWVDRFHSRKDQNPGLATLPVRVVLSPLSISPTSPRHTVKVGPEVQTTVFTVVSALTGSMPVRHIGANFARISTRLIQEALTAVRTSLSPEFWPNARRQVAS